MGSRRVRTEPTENGEAAGRARLQAVTWEHEVRARKPQWDRLDGRPAGRLAERCGPSGTVGPCPCGQAYSRAVDGHGASNCTGLVSRSFLVDPVLKIVRQYWCQFWCFVSIGPHFLSFQNSYYVID